MYNIPKGYQLSIHSWENDSDNHKVEQVHGLTSEDVKFYIYFLQHFYPDFYKNQCGCHFGNVDYVEAPDAEQTALKNAYAFCKPTSKQLLEDVEFCIKSECSGDFVYELIGIWHEGSRYRVFECANVHYIPDEIMDCTNQFVKEED